MPDTPGENRNLNDLSARGGAASGQSFGLVGLGLMGGNLARQALSRRLRVAGYDLRAPPGDLIAAGLRSARSVSALATGLTRPRIVLLYVPAGRPVDAVIEELSPSLDHGDIIADGGNSYWRDSIQRQRRLMDQGVHFVDLGTSGGVDGARHGACFMAGGEPEPIARIESLLRQLAVPGGYVHAGPPGAGHFTKLVHNGIEFGMLQAIGEGLALLERHPGPLPIADVLRCWRHGSVVRSWLIDLLEQSYRERGGAGDVPAHVEDTGEVSWLVEDALRMEVPVPVIAQSVMQLFASRDRARTWARAIAMMRHGFGGHPLGPDAAVARERREGRIARDP